jgi:hypothetical protein
VIDLLKPPADLSKPHLVMIVNRTTRLRPLRQLGPGVYHLETDVRPMIRGRSAQAAAYKEVEFHWLAGNTKQVMQALGRLPPDPTEELAAKAAAVAAEAAEKEKAAQAEAARIAAEKAANEAQKAAAEASADQEPIILEEEPEHAPEPEPEA